MSENPEGVVKNRTPNLIYKIDPGLKLRLSRQAAFERRTIKAVLEAALAAYIDAAEAKHAAEQAAPYTL